MISNLEGLELILAEWERHGAICAEHVLRMVRLLCVSIPTSMRLVSVCFVVFFCFIHFNAIHSSCYLQGEEGRLSVPRIRTRAPILYTNSS